MLRNDARDTAIMNRVGNTTRKNQVIWLGLLTLLVMLLQVAPRLLAQGTVAPRATAGNRGQVAQTNPGRQGGATRTATTGPAPVVRGSAPASAPAPAAPANAAGGHLSDQDKTQLQTVAVVNGEEITGAYLATECLRRYGEEVLETMVNKHLILQECQARGITITEQDVEDEINQMATKFGLTKQRWLELLEKEREITGDKYRREIIWPTLALRRLAASQITVSPEELKKAFDSQYGPSVKARLISVSDRAKADQLHQLLMKDPEQFGELAKSHSEDTNSAAARGLSPPIRKHVGFTEVEQVAFAMKEGEISPVIQVANQYLILKCEQHVPATYISSANLKPIEAQLHDQIRDDKLRTAAADMFQQMQAKARVVNVYNDPVLRQQMPNVAATVNDRSIPLDLLQRECLQRNGSEVLEGEINRLLLQQELKRKGKTVTQPMLDEEVARAADAYGYLAADGSPDVKAWLATVTRDSGASVDLYVRDAVWPSVALKALVGQNVQINDDDLQKGFESNYGERVEVLAIVMTNQRHANQVWEEARKRPTDQAFGELAHEHSVEPVSRANFGKVPPIRRFGGQPVIEEEAFRLKPGELSGIIATGDKYVVLRCLGRTQPVVREFKTVEEELKKDLTEKKLRVAMATEFDRLKNAAQIDNFLDGISQTGKANVAETLPAPTSRPNAAAAAPANATPAAPRTTTRPTGAVRSGR